MPQGRVKWFSDARRYGFIVVEGEPDVFVHLSEVRQGARPFRLRPGDLVDFDVTETARGPKATNVQLVEVASWSGTRSRSDIALRVGRDVAKSLTGGRKGEVAKLRAPLNPEGSSDPDWWREH